MQEMLVAARPGRGNGLLQAHSPDPRKSWMRCSVEVRDHRAEEEELREGDGKEEGQEEGKVKSKDP